MAAIDDCFDGAFGAAGAEVVIEEFLTARRRASSASATAPRRCRFGTAQDHKRVGDGDTGPNTGGMGAYSPAPVMTPEMVERTMSEIIEPTMRGMAESGRPFAGVLFAGLMITDKGPKLIEYNVRFGDPECQVLMMRLKSDLLPLLYAAPTGSWPARRPTLARRGGADRRDGAEGYPGTPRKAPSIGGVDRRTADGVKVFHAGTARERMARWSPLAAACSTSPRPARRSARHRRGPMPPSTRSTGRTASAAATSAGRRWRANRRASERQPTAGRDRFRSKRC